MIAGAAPEAAGAAAGASHDGAAGAQAGAAGAGAGHDGAGAADCPYCGAAIAAAAKNGRTAYTTT